MMKIESEATCPACRTSVTLASQSQLLATERAYLAEWSAREGASGAFTPRVDGMRALACDPATHGRWFWACDRCLETGLAIAADVTKQTLGVGTPFAAYVPRPFTCSDCACEAVFSPAEQKHWFETLGFLIWVYPKQCAPCRVARRKRARASTILAEALHGLDPEDPSQLEAIACLYEELGSHAKAETFHARARNRQRTRTEGDAHGPR